MNVFTKLIFATFICLISLVANASDKGFIYSTQNPDVNIDVIKNNLNETFIEFDNENNIPAIRNNKNPKISAFKTRKHNLNSSSQKDNILNCLIIAKNNYFYKTNYSNSNKIVSVLKNEIVTRAP